MKHLNVSKNAVLRWWEVPWDAADTAFAESTGRGRKMKKTDAQQRSACKKLEKDTKGVVRRVAADIGVSKSTMYTYAHRQCDKKRRATEVLLTPNTKRKRLEYATSKVGSDHSATAFADHTLLTIPPQSHGSTVWRLKGSTKPVAKRLKFKRRSTMMVLFACSGNSVSPPCFNVRRVRLKRRRPGEATLGYRWEKFNINADAGKKDLKHTIFPWMREKKLKELVLDNAGCQDGLRQFIEEEGFTSPGFGGMRRDHSSGFAANSPALIPSSSFHQWQD